MTGGIIEIDVHGKNTEEAKKAISVQIHYVAGNQGVLMIGGIRIGTGDKGCG